MPTKRDVDLPRRHPDVRIHKGHPASDNAKWDGVDHNECPGPPGFEPTVLAFSATCRTPGCRAEGQTGQVEAAVNADGIVRILCGACNEWIEDYA